MSKIFCYSLDFKKKEKEFANLDALLKEIVGVKDQAEKAVDNPDVSYHGFRLISEEKLPSLFATIISERTEKIKNDYVDNITTLESEIKTLQKNERKHTTKVSVLKEEFEEDMAKSVSKSEKELADLIKKQTETVNSLEKTHAKKLDDLTLKFQKDIKDLLDTNESDKLTYVKKLESYSNELKGTIKEYNSKLSIIKDKHNLKSDKYQKELITKLQSEVKNKEILIQKLEFKLNEIVKSSKQLEELVNKMIVNENTISKNKKELVDFKVDSYIKEVENSTDTYQEIKVSELIEDTKISIEPLFLTTPVDKKENIETNNSQTLIFSKKDTTLIEKNGVPVSKANSDKVEQKPLEKETKPLEKEQETVKPNVKEDRYLIISNVAVLKNKFFETLSSNDKGVALFNYFNKGLGKNDLPYKDLDTYLKDKDVLLAILKLMQVHNKSYKELEKELDLEMSKEVFSVLAPTRIEFNTFFGIKDQVTVKEEPKKVEKVKESEKETLVKQSKKDNLEFDWKEFRLNYERTDDVKLILSKDSISIREASVFLSIPAAQVKNMISVMVQVGEKSGYTKEFKNNSLLSPNELLLLIVSEGWLQSSTRVNKSETLQSIIVNLFPSWLEYRNSK